MFPKLFRRTCHPAGSIDAYLRKILLSMVMLCPALLHPLQAAQGSNSDNSEFENLEIAFKSAIISSGTGFIVTQDGYVITSLHVVDSPGRIFVRVKEDTYEAQLVKSDRANDIALLKISGHFEALLIAASRSVNLGDVIFTIGFPNPGIQGIEAKFTKGEINSLAGINDDPRYFQISAQVQPGNSGGPVLNELGNVIGIVALRLDDLEALKVTGSLPQNVNYAIKSSFINGLLESVPAAMKYMVSPQNLPTSMQPDLIQAVSDAVGMVFLMRTSQSKEPTRSMDKSIIYDVELLRDPDYQASVQSEKGSIQGLKLAQALASRHPNSSIASYRLGQWYLDMDFTSDSIDAFLHTTKLSPEYAAAWTGLCRAYRKAGKSSDAVNACRQAIKLDPENVDHWISLGKTYVAFSNSKDAIGAFQNALKIEPENADTWAELGGAYRATSRWSDAISACQKSVSLDRNNSKALGCLGFSYGSLQKYTDAINAFERAIRLQPDNAQSWFGLALYLSQTGQHKAAQKAHSRLRDLDPDLANRISELLMLNRIRR